MPIILSNAHKSFASQSIQLSNNNSFKSTPSTGQLNLNSDPKTSFQKAQAINPISLSFGSEKIIPYTDIVKYDKNRRIPHLPNNLLKEAGIDVTDVENFKEVNSDILTNKASPLSQLIANEFVDFIQTLPQSERNILFTISATTRLWDKAITGTFEKGEDTEDLSQYANIASFKTLIEQPKLNTLLGSVVTSYKDNTLFVINYNGGSNVSVTAYIQPQTNIKNDKSKPIQVQSALLIFSKLKQYIQGMLTNLDEQPSIQKDNETVSFSKFAQFPVDGLNNIFNNEDKIIRDKKGNDKQHKDLIKKSKLALSILLELPTEIDTMLNNSSSILTQLFQKLKEAKVQKAPEKKTTFNRLQDYPAFSRYIFQNLVSAIDPIEVALNKEPLINLGKFNYDKSSLKDLDIAQHINRYIFPIAQFNNEVANILNKFKLNNDEFNKAWKETKDWLGTNS